jgi:hypothetical protein
MTDYKLWYFGRSIKRKRPDLKNHNWEDLLQEKELILFIHTRSLTGHQINCIKTGFNEEPFENINEYPGKFPFGVHKGKRFEDVPERYIVWCSEQDWIEKWPTVKNYISKFLQERDGGMTKEEIKQFFNEANT